MKTIPAIQIVVSIALVITILLQNRGSGLSATFGGDFGGYYTKRGIERFLYFTSVGLSIVFLGLAIGAFLLEGRA